MLDEKIKQKMKKKQERKDDKIGQQFFAPKHRKNESNYF